MVCLWTPGQRCLPRWFYRELVHADLRWGLVAWPAHVCPGGGLKGLALARALCVPRVCEWAWRCTPQGACCGLTPGGGRCCCPVLTRLLWLKSPPGQDVGQGGAAESQAVSPRRSVCPTPLCCPRAPAGGHFHPAGKRAAGEEGSVALSSPSECHLLDTWPPLPP